MENYLKIFKALSERTRLRIINLFLRSGRELCVCEIVDALSETQYNISKHLKELKYAGLVEERKMGRWVSYRLTAARTEFLANIFNSLQSLQDDVLLMDLKRLEGRFSLRQEGRCVIGLGSKQWEKILRKIEAKKERSD